MNKFIRLGTVIAAIAGLCLFTGCIEEQHFDTLSTTTKSTTTITETTTTMFYEKNELINAFLIRYNEINPTSQIKKEDFSVYSHHGSEHHDQIRGWIDGIEFVITANDWSETIKVVLDGSINTKNNEYEALFKGFVNAFCNAANETQLSQYWQSALDGSFENEWFECYVQAYDNEIELISIEGSFEI